MLKHKHVILVVSLVVLAVLTGGIIYVTIFSIDNSDNAEITDLDKHTISQLDNQLSSDISDEEKQDILHFKSLELQSSGDKKGAIKSLEEAKGINLRPDICSSLYNLYIDSDTNKANALLIECLESLQNKQDKSEVDNNWIKYFESLQNSQNPTTEGGENDLAS